MDGPPSLPHTSVPWPCHFHITLLVDGLNTLCHPARPLRPIWMSTLRPSSSGRVQWFNDSGLVTLSPISAYVDWARWASPWFNPCDLSCHVGSCKNARIASVAVFPCCGLTPTLILCHAWPALASVGTHSPTRIRQPRPLCRSDPRQQSDQRRLSATTLCPLLIFLPSFVAPPGHLELHTPPLFSLFFFFSSFNFLQFLCLTPYLHHA